MPSQVGYETVDSGHEATGAPSAGGKSTLVVVVSAVSNCRQTLPTATAVSTRSPFGCDPPKLTVAAAAANIKTREIHVVLRIMTL